MAARDKFHDLVKEALIKQKWKVTDDPYSFGIGEVAFEIDLGAEKLIKAEKQNKKIAVEIKSFIKPSPVQDMHEAVGKYEIYLFALAKKEPDRQLFLAIPRYAYDDFFQRPFVQDLISEKKINIIVYDTDKREIVKWIIN
jgi:hypothetical protein